MFRAAFTIKVCNDNHFLVDFAKKEDMYHLGPVLHTMIPKGKRKVCFEITGDSVKLNIVDELGKFQWKKYIAPYIHTDDNNNLYFIANDHMQLIKADLRHLSKEQSVIDEWNKVFH